MKILMINVVCGIRSTGRICTDLAVALEKHNHIVRIAYGRGNVPDQYCKYAVKIGSSIETGLHGLKSRLFDASGFGSKLATTKFIKWVKEYDPDIIHVHNIHGYYINIEILFHYLRLCQKKIIWTLHDCWPFTGHSAFCETIQCEQWKTGCIQCPQTHEYPKTWTDHSAHNWIKKKQMFTQIPEMTLVTPSIWLAHLVNASFLSEYPTHVIYNTVPPGIFKPTNSGLREKYGLIKQKIVLGVAAIWDKRKGLDDFYKLRSRLDKTYSIILIGLSKNQIHRLPDGLIGISKTDSPKELAAFYTLADVFVNPTYEDNYPTTNLEAISCGTPVVTYNTGGSPESANLYGITVEKGDVDALAKAIRNIDQLEKKVIDIDFQSMAAQYIHLYEALLQNERQQA